jgi:hypothetical protein
VVLIRLRAFVEEPIVTKTPHLDLDFETGFVFDENGRMISTREPDPRPAPLFTISRTMSNCVWAVRVGVPENVVAELDRLARTEPLMRDFQDPPMHADEYLALVGGEVASGPDFLFPDQIEPPADIVMVDSLSMLERHFRGWTASEIPERSPILAIVDGGYPVSVCFCARNTKTSAAAGVETAAAFRGRGFAQRMTAAWALAIRASGRTPFYGTSWSNTASRAVARKLGLVLHASHWSLADL